MTNQDQTVAHYLQRAYDLGVPPHTAEPLAFYIAIGRPTGGFLQAVISNDLAAAVARADSINRRALPDIVVFLFNDAPSASWGNPEAYTTWLARHGLLGEQT